MPTVTTLSGKIIAVDFLTRDFEGFRASVLETGGLADQYTPNWTDRSELDVGVALVEAWAFMADNLSYYQDRCANEALFATAVQRRSVIEHCRSIGYSLSPNTSSVVDLTVVCKGTATQDGTGTIPAGTQIGVDTSDGSEDITFEFKDDFVATHSLGDGVTYEYAGAEAAVAIHGTTVTESPFSSSGSADQRFSLSKTPMTAPPGESSSIQVWVTESIPELWAEVDNFLESEATDKVYRVEISEEDLVTVIFSDGVNGKIPNVGSSNIQVYYRIGGGSAGNEVARNKLTSLKGSFPFVYSITNPSYPSGGTEKESIKQAKVNAPLSLKAMGRAVTHDDYKALALQSGGITKAHAFRGVGAYEEHVVVSAGGSNPVPTGTWNPFTETGTLMLGSVGEYLKTRKTTPTILHIDPVRVVDIWLTVTAYLFAGVRQSNVSRLVYESILYLLHPDNQDLGGRVPMSRMSQILEDIAGVDYIDFVRCQRQPSARHLYGSSDVTFGSFTCNQASIADRWRVNFVSPTEFTVIGSASGQQSNTGTLGVVYTTDGGEIEFLATAGSTPPSVIDKFEFITGPYIGNLSVDSDEVIRLQEGYFNLYLIGGVG